MAKGIIKRIPIESKVMEYSGIKALTGVTYKTFGETDETKFIKEFRYSSDKILWSDLKELNNKNISSVKIYDNKVYIQYVSVQLTRH